MKFTAFQSACVHQSKGSKPTGSIVGYFRSEIALRAIQHNTLVDLLSSLHMLSKPKQNLAWKQVAAVTTVLQQSIRNELDAQDRIPNKWKELLRNRLVKSLSHAAEKYFRKHMRRHQRNMSIAIEIP